MGLLTGLFGEPSEDRRIATRVAYLERLEKRGNLGAAIALSLYRDDPNGSGYFALFNDEYVDGSQD